MTQRVLSTRDLNRALLARQLLLDRSDLDIPEALEQVAGLQAQYAPSPYVGLWSRLRDFGRDDLTRALEERRAVQATLLRVTIHIVSAPTTRRSPRPSGPPAATGGPGRSAVGWKGWTWRRRPPWSGSGWPTGRPARPS